MYTDVVLLVVLIALAFNTPSAVTSLTSTRLGKVLLLCSTLALALYRGRNAGILAALITVLLLHKETKEGMKGEKADEEESSEDEAGEEDDKADNDDEKSVCSGETTESEDKESKTTAKETTKEGFLGSGQICSVLASSRLSLGEALRSIGSNKLPVSSTRGNGGKQCPEGTICPQSKEAVKCGFFS